MIEVNTVNYTSFGVFTNWLAIKDISAKPVPA
jgi:hypothetical protein